MIHWTATVNHCAVADTWVWKSNLELASKALLGAPASTFVVQGRSGNIDNFTGFGLFLPYFGYF